MGHCNRSLLLDRGVNNYNQPTNQIALLPVQYRLSSGSGTVPNNPAGLLFKILWLACDSERTCFKVAQNSFQHLDLDGSL